MNQAGGIEDWDADKTLPNVEALRCQTLPELYAELPHISKLVGLAPNEDDTAGSFLDRLVASDTPEDSIAFLSFAARPRMAIWWAYECLVLVHDNRPGPDDSLLVMVADWIGSASSESRYRVMRAALYAPEATPVVHLGLAVGWSGGPIAPNDPARVPTWRCPRSVSTALLDKLATVGLENRSAHLANFIHRGRTLLMNA